MKKQDIIIIVLIAGLSAIGSFFISDKLFSSPQKRTSKVEIVNKIVSDFADPKSANYASFFNTKALNPTQQITIGDTPNSKPFSGTR